mgnify:FL=1
MKIKRLPKKILAVLLTCAVAIGMFISTPATAAKAAGKPTLTYFVHAQTHGWMQPVAEGRAAGTTGQAKRLEAIGISLSANGMSGTLSYRVHAQSYGWMNWVDANTNGASPSAMIAGRQFAGTTGQGKRLEAIQIRLTGELAEHYDVLYRVHCQTYGWSTWCRNGATAGTTGKAKRLESIEIKLIEKADADLSASIRYSVHAQTYGWMNTVSDGTLAGTTGEAKRLEAIKIALQTTGITGGVEYKTHVQSYGWQNAVSNGTVSGTTGQGKRLEAISINLTGDISAYYDVYYRVHCQSYGWLDWASNGQDAGTKGGAKRMEAIQIKLVKKGEAAPGATTRPFVDIASLAPTKDTYEIRVNKQQSCVTIYKDGTPIKAMTCSPGDATPLGTFPLSTKWRWTSLMGGVQGQYVSQISGNFLFHSVLYGKADPRTLVASSYNNLGKRVSHGCVRLRVADAKWIYDNCPQGTRITIYNSNDPGPLGKPVLDPIPSGQNYDPSDPSI